MIADSTISLQVSIILPCLNEARTVGACVAKAFNSLRNLNVSGEVIVADNGSTDGSQAVAREAGAKVTHVESPGYGAAIKGGILVSQGQFIILGDADDSYDLNRLEGFMARLNEGDDLVMGNRFEGGILPGAMPWLNRYLGNPALTAILNLFFRTGVGDAHCGLRAIRRKAYDSLVLVTDGMEFASEMVVKASLMGLRISETPVVLHPDGRGRRPHLRPIHDGCRHLYTLFLLCPFWLFFIPASSLLLLGLFQMGWYSALSESRASDAALLHSMTCGAFFVLVGYQLYWFGLSANTIGRLRRARPSDPLSRDVIGGLTSGQSVIMGATILVGSSVYCLWLLFVPTSMNADENGFRSLTMRSLWGLTVMAIGAQTVFGSCFVGFLSFWIEQVEDAADGPESPRSELRDEAPAIAEQ